MLPDHGVADGGLRDFISGTWTEAAEAAEVEYCAIVADGLQGLAIEQAFDAPGVTMDTFQETEEAVSWLEKEL